MNFEDQPWRLRRACAGKDPTLWITDGTPPMGRSRTRVQSPREAKAKKICWNVCEVREACLEAGEGHPGIWGGLDEWERSGTGRLSNKLTAPFPADIRESLNGHSKYVQQLRSAQELTESLR